jgi:hypothetical protein
MKHRLFPMLVRLSILLLAFSLSLCLRSFKWLDRLENRDEENSWRRTISLSSARGSVRFRWEYFSFRDDQRNRVYTNEQLGWHWLSERVGRGSLFETTYENSSGRDVMGCPYRQFTASLSYLYLIGSGAVPVCVWISTARSRRRRTRRCAGACLHCGYDLRSSSDRCPECGTPIQRS